eukprot:2648750-Pyramimonas_sp.AAC.1
MRTGETGSRAHDPQRVVVTPAENAWELAWEEATPEIERLRQNVAPAPPLRVLRLLPWLEYPLFDCFALTSNTPVHRPIGEPAGCRKAGHGAFGVTSRTVFKGVLSLWHRWFDAYVFAAIAASKHVL